MSTDINLSPQEVLDLARKWQLDPVAETQDLDKEKEIIPVLRDDELAQIQKITKLNVSQTDFNHAFGWIVAEGKILDFIEEEFRNKQPDPGLLEQLAKEKDLVESKKTIWEKHHQKNQERFAAKTNEEQIKTLTDQNFRDELEPKPAQLTGEKREILNVSSPASPPPPSPTRVQVGLSGAHNWRANFMHPEQYFGKVFSSFKNSLARTFGKKAVVGTAAKAGIKGLAAKLGAFIPTGVTQAIAIASTISSLIPPEIKEKLKDLWSAIQIGMAGVVGWLLMNLGALAGGIIGGMIGGFVGGPIGAAVGFGAGAFLGYSLQGILGPMLFPGTAGGIGAPIIPAIISIGGFTLPAGFSALLSGSGLSTIVLFGVGGGIGLVSLFTVLTVITVGATQKPEEQPLTNEGSLFSVEKTVDRNTLPNDSSSVITYTVSITGTTDIEIIKINDELTQENKTGSKKFLAPSVTWPAKLNKGETETISIPYQITGASYNDSNLVNVVEVTAKFGSKTETLTARAMVTIGNPNYTNDRCQIGLDNGYCAVSKLLPYFGSQAENASRICVAESEGMKSPSRLGKPDTINNSCAKNLSPEKMREYSVGLFQINLWGHDNFCKEILGGQTPFRKPYYAKCTYPDCTPCDRDEDLLKQCKDYWIQPEHNYEAAKRLFDGRKGSWIDWSVAKAEYCNIP
ncbi:hypothetical protein HY085_01310 [Candidatus Gottesmanbacteria bacterium]|nr:hypothetical protein [Candidatus Gottesmanbacteria bacterium]